MRLIELAFWFYVGTVVGCYTLHLFREGPAAAFMKTSFRVRYHLFLVCMAAVTPVMSVAEWLVVTHNDEGEQKDG